MPLVVSLECSEAETGLLVAELYEAGTLGVIEEQLADRCLLRAYFDDGAGAAVARFAARGAEVTQEAPTDWSEVARRRWHSVLVGERFFLAPPWSTESAPSGRLRLEMPPGTAPGTGLHEGTRLLLEALERHVRGGDRVLDLGTGSGILTAAARALGAGPVVACDIDESAAAAARMYLHRLAPEARLFVGSLRSLRSGLFEIVAANISAPAIVSLARDIARVLRPGGYALVGGFTERETGRVEQALHGAGMTAPLEVLAENAWRSLALRREEYSG